MNSKSRILKMRAPIAVIARRTVRCHEFFVQRTFMTLSGVSKPSSNPNSQNTKRHTNNSSLSILNTRSTSALLNHTAGTSLLSSISTSPRYFSSKNGKHKFKNTLSKASDLPRNSTDSRIARGTSSAQGPESLASEDPFITSSVPDGWTPEQSKTSGQKGKKRLGGIFSKGTLGGAKDGGGRGAKDKLYDSQGNALSTNQPGASLGEYRPFDELSAEEQEKAIAADRAFKGEHFTDIEGVGTTYDNTGRAMSFGERAAEEKRNEILRAAPKVKTDELGNVTATIGVDGIASDEDGGSFTSTVGAPVFSQDIGMGADSSDASTTALAPETLEAMERRSAERALPLKIPPEGVEIYENRAHAIEFRGRARQVRNLVLGGTAMQITGLGLVMTTFSFPVPQLMPLFYLAFCGMMLNAARTCHYAWKVIGLQAFRMLESVRVFPVDFDLKAARQAARENKALQLQPGSAHLLPAAVGARRAQEAGAKGSKAKDLTDRRRGGGKSLISTGKSGSSKNSDQATRDDKLAAKINDALEPNIVQDSLPGKRPEEDHGALTGHQDLDLGSAAEFSYSLDGSVAIKTLEDSQGRRRTEHIAASIEDRLGATRNIRIHFRSVNWQSQAILANENEDYTREMYPLLSKQIEKMDFYWKKLERQGPSGHFDMVEKMQAQLEATYFENKALQSFRGLMHALTASKEKIILEETVFADTPFHNNLHEAEQHQKKRGRDVRTEKDYMDDETLFADAEHRRTKRSRNRGRSAMGSDEEQAARTGRSVYEDDDGDVRGKKKKKMKPLLLAEAGNSGSTSRGSRRNLNFSGRNGGATATAEMDAEMPSWFEEEERAQKKKREGEEAVANGTYSAHKPGLRGFFQQLKERRNRVFETVEMPWGEELEVRRRTAGEVLVSWCPMLTAEGACKLLAPLHLSDNVQIDRIFEKKRTGLGTDGGQRTSDPRFVIEPVGQKPFTLGVIWLAMGCYSVYHQNRMITMRMSQIQNFEEEMEKLDDYNVPLSPQAERIVRVKKMFDEGMSVEEVEEAERKYFEAWKKENPDHPDAVADDEDDEEEEGMPSASRSMGRPAKEEDIITLKRVKKVEQTASEE